MTPVVGSLPELDLMGSAVTGRMNTTRVSRDHGPSIAVSSEEYASVPAIVAARFTSPLERPFLLLRKYA